MTRITSQHFGGNLLLTNDHPVPGSPFQAMLDEVGFSAFRYPGGGVTEAQTWENGGLQRIFGAPLSADDPNDVFTLNEALSRAAETGTGLTLVIPTFQFRREADGDFDEKDFAKYISHLETALTDHPNARIVDLEIGNEYWGSLNFQAMTASEYGAVANAQIPLLQAMLQRVSDARPNWQVPGIGIQAGAAWRDSGEAESQDIAAALDPGARAAVSTIFQHSYPDMSRQDSDWQLNWAVDPMRVFAKEAGFRPDLKLSVSEFNIAANSAVGLEQGAAWIEEFAVHIDAGIDEFHHWGLAYKWLSNKFYDTHFPIREAESGTVQAIATPMGQVYDLAETLLIGKSTLSDAEALADLRAAPGLEVTGFADATQRVVFFYNEKGGDQTIALDGLARDHHVAVSQLVAADSPLTDYDESLDALPPGDQVVDSRADMHVTAAPDHKDPITLGKGQMAVLTISDRGRDLEIEGAHHATDAATGLVDDDISGGAGDDILRGHVGDDRLGGGKGRDLIGGGAGDDRIRGGAGGDLIQAGTGRDRVDAGAGDDVIAVAGGTDRDSLVIATGAGRDLILAQGGHQLSVSDFGAQDRLGFDGAFATEADLAAASRTEGRDLVVNLADEGELRLTGAVERMPELASQVIDFKADPAQLDELGEQVFHGLTPDQTLEARDLLGSIDGLDDATGEGRRYWDDLAETPPPDDDTPSLPPRQPDPEDDEGETDEQDPDSVAGGACFVATAAFGDPDHPDVRALRGFRDRHLIRHPAGRIFVRFYWIIGPVLARHTRPGNAHARLARLLLSAFVRAIQRRGLLGT